MRQDVHGPPHLVHRVAVLDEGRVEGGEDAAGRTNDIGPHARADHQHHALREELTGGDGRDLARAAEDVVEGDVAASGGRRRTREGCVGRAKGGSARVRGARAAPAHRQTEYRSSGSGVCSSVGTIPSGSSASHERGTPFASKAMSSMLLASPATAPTKPQKQAIQCARTSVMITK